MMKECAFYQEWLPLDKEFFRILAIIADYGGTFRGNLSDLCRSLSLSVQTNNRAKLAAAIDYLAEAGFLDVQKQGRTYTLKVIPKGEEIGIAKRWLRPILRQEYCGETVSPEAVLKVLAWITANRLLVVTDAEISAELNLSPDTIGKAKNVLSKEVKAIQRKIIKEKIAEGEYRNIGQELTAIASWSEV